VSLSPYLITQEEELIHLCAVGLERLEIFLCHGVEGRLDDVVLVDLKSIGVGPSFLHA
jgi:hypothetical protein